MEFFPKLLECLIEYPVQVFSVVSTGCMTGYMGSLYKLCTNRHTIQTELSRLIGIGGHYARAPVTGACINE